MTQHSKTLPLKLCSFRSRSAKTGRMVLENLENIEKLKATWEFLGGRFREQQELLAQIRRQNSDLQARNTELVEENRRLKAELEKR